MRTIGQERCRIIAKFMSHGLVVQEVALNVARTVVQDVAQVLSDLPINKEIKGCRTRAT